MVLEGMEAQEAVNIIIKYCKLRDNDCTGCAIHDFCLEIRYKRPSQCIKYDIGD